MPASLRIQLKERGYCVEDVLQYYKENHTDSEGMEHFFGGNKDWISWQKFKREVGLSETCGMGINRQDPQDLLSQAIELFANKLTQVIAQNQEIIEKQAKEIARLKSQLALLDDRDTGRAVEALSRLKALSI